MPNPVPAAARQELRDAITDALVDYFDPLGLNELHEDVIADLAHAADAVLAAIEPLLAEEAELRDGNEKALAWATDSNGAVVGIEVIPRPHAHRAVKCWCYSAEGVGHVKPPDPPWPPTRPEREPVVNEYDPQHPHEPEIAPALDDEGRCLVCKLIVERDAALAATETSDTVANRYIDGWARSPVSDEWWDASGSDTPQERPPEPMSPREVVHFAALDRKEDANG